VNPKTNVLIFPCGSENAMDIFDSLKYNIHFQLFGATSQHDHSQMIFPNDNLFIGDLYITQPNFLEELNKLIKLFRIEYIIPTHDTIAMYLAKNRENISAYLICSPYETARVAENKNLTYNELKDAEYYPRIFSATDFDIPYPVFVKPFVGAGGKGAFQIKNKEELESALEKKSDLLICEYLPGKEYTVDCFTNKNRELLFFGARTRERVTMGITFHSERAEPNPDFEIIANDLNRRFIFSGSWFFQVKENEFGKIKLLEFSVRHAGTMAFFRQLGVNFAALSLFDAMGYDVKVLFNDYPIILDRRLQNSYKFIFEYNTIYIDFDDTIIINDKVNTSIIKFLFQSKNANKKIILLTKHIFDIRKSMRKYHICSSLFDSIVIVETEKEKADYVIEKKSIFIDNYFPERISVMKKCKIPVFDVDSVELLIDASQV